MRIRELSANRYADKARKERDVENISAFNVVKLSAPRGRVAMGPRISAARPKFTEEIANSL